MMRGLAAFGYGSTAPVRFAARRKFLFGAIAFLLLFCWGLWSVAKTALMVLHPELAGNGEGEAHLREDLKSLSDHQAMER